jgi:GTPase SAR1 family protein
MVKIYAVGTAGAGKSTFVGAFADWLEAIGASVVIVNLDPGAEELPYEPDIDIRERFTLPMVMKEYNLGPNGAQVVASDLVAMEIKNIKNEMEKIEYDYALIDTPGQLELFAFRGSSLEITDTLGREDSMLAFLFDPIISKEPSGFATLLMLSAAVNFRFSLPFLNLLGKTDLLNQEQLNRILDWSMLDDALYNALREEKDMRSTFNLEVFKAMELLGTYRKVIPISAFKLARPSENNIEKVGFQEVYTISREIFGAGEDIDTGERSMDEGI